MKIENFNPCAMIRVRDLQRYERAARRQLQVAQRQLVQKYGLPSSGQVHEIVARLCLEGLSLETQEKLQNFDQVLSERMGQAKRHSGEPEINHLRRSVDQMNQDGIRDPALDLALLGHDSVEDGYLTLDEVEEICGPEVRMLIDAKTKLSKDIEKERRERESLIKLLEAALKDPRVILLGAYDSFDNWRDQSIFLEIPGKEHKPREHAEEAYVISQFLHALNFWLMRVRLEDRVLEYYDPNYAGNIELYNAAAARCFDDVEKIADEIKKILNRAGIEATVTHSVKAYSEIYRKCREKKMSMAALFNKSPLYAHYISIVTDEIKEVNGQDPEGVQKINIEICGRARIVVNLAGKRLGLFKPEPRTVDNLVEPKDNGYRAHHTYVSLPGKGIFMIGYTTRGFDQENRFGTMIARGIRTGFAPGWAKMDPLILRRLRAFMREMGLMTVKDMRDNIPAALSPIKVFSPGREEIEIKEGATALDFALTTNHIHVGRIRVNGTEVDYDTELREGDVVEVGEDGDSPHPSWLLSVHTHEASAKIREFLRQLPPDKRREIGVEALNKLFDKRYLKWQEDKAASEIKPVSGIKTTSEIKSTSEVREMLEYFSGIYRDQIASLAQKGILDRNDLQGNNLKPEGLEILVGIGQIDIQEVENVFDGIFKASLDRRKAQKEETAFAILFNVAQNRAGLQEEIERDIKAAGFDIKKDAAMVNSDESATFGYVFEIYSTVEQRQIENIVIRNNGEILIPPLRLRIKAQSFQLAKWLAEHGVVI